MRNNLSLFLVIWQLFGSFRVSHGAERGQKRRVLGRQDGKKESKKGGQDGKKESKKSGKDGKKGKKGGFLFDTYEKAFVMPSRPEGSAAIDESHVLASGITSGSVNKIEVATNLISELVPAAPDRLALGLGVYEDTLLVAGGGQVPFFDSIEAAYHIFDINSGTKIQSCPTPPGGFINDILIYKDTAYMTDSLLPHVIVVDLEEDPESCEYTTIDLEPIDEFIPPNFQSNGIAVYKDEALIISTNGGGKIFSLSLKDYEVKELASGLRGADGLIVNREYLYVVKNSVSDDPTDPTAVVVFEFKKGGKELEFKDRIEADEFENLATGVIVGDALYLTDLAMNSFPDEDKGFVHVMRTEE